MDAQPPPDDKRSGRPPQHSDRAPALLVLVIVLTAASLLVTLSLLFSGPDTGPTSVALMRSVTLVVDGQARTLWTSAATVGELLNEQEIALAPEDALSDPETAPLVHNMTLYVGRARDVTLVINGVENIFRTPYTYPHDILRSYGLELDEDDQVWVDGTQTTPDALPLWPVPATSITVQEAVTVTVDDSGLLTTLVTTADTVGDALFEADIVLYLADTVTPDVTAPLSPGLTIIINRAAPISITADGITLETRVQGGTVMDAVAEAGILLAGLDYTLPDGNEPVTAAMEITVVRVTEELLTTQHSVPFGTIYEADATMELDTRTTVRAGAAGLDETRVRVRYEDGVEVSRTDEGTTRVREPVDAIVRYGTSIVIRTVETPDGPLEYWRVLRGMLTTSYHPGSVGGSTTTSIGMTLTYGIIAADPGIIPYRTNLYVPGYGVGVMADTGGPRSTRYWIDLGYDDDNFVPWSRRTDVYLLTPVPENINYLLPAR